MINHKDFIKADPGTYKVYGRQDKDGILSFCKVPVVAWYMYAENHERASQPNEHLYSFPVTPGDDCDGWSTQNNEGLLFPCGTVMVPCAGTYSSAEEWLESMREYMPKDGE